MNEKGTRNLEILESLLGEKVQASKTTFEAFILDILSMSINLLLGLYLVLPEDVQSGANFLVQQRRGDRWVLDLESPGAREPGGIPPSNEVHPNIDTYSYKCATS